MAVLPGVLSIAQAGAGFASASQAASAQNAYFESNRKAAIVAANDRYASINNRASQETAAASQELFQKQIDAMKTRATASVAGGEAGVNGVSVDALMGDLLAQQGRQMQAVQTNWEFQNAHDHDEMQATYDNTVQRINSVRQAASPSLLPYIIQGAAGIVSPKGQKVATEYA